MVILEEIAMRDDDPEDTLADAFAGAVFAGHPIGSPVIGTVETIEAMTRTQIAGYYHRRYSPDRMVVAVAGGVDHADVLRWVRTAFRDRLSSIVRLFPRRFGPGTAASNRCATCWSSSGTPSRRTCVSGCRPAIGTTPTGPRWPCCPPPSAAG